MKDIENRRDIEVLMEAFYKKALDDEKIGHFFTKVVQLDLNTHLPKICDFWEGILLDARHYKGNPIKVHQDLNRLETIEAHHFQHWLHLFKETVDQLFKGQKASLAKERALSIATVMQIKLSAVG